MIRLRRAWTPPNCCGIDQTFWDRICELRISEGATPAPKSRRRTHSMGVKQQFYGLRGVAEISEAFKGKVSRPCISISCMPRRNAIGAWNSKTRWCRCTRYARSVTIRSQLRLIRLCTAFFRLPMSTICTRTGELRWPRRQTGARKWRNLIGGLSTA